MPLTPSRNWQLSVDDTDPLATILRDYLPPSAENAAGILLLPIVAPPEITWSPWNLFPPELAVLLAQVPRDAVYAFDSDACASVIGPTPNSASSWEWLCQVFFAGITVETLSPLLATDISTYRHSLPDLGPKRPGHDRDWLLAALKSTSAEWLLPDSIDPVSRTALQAGIFQWHDYLEESHSCSQQIEGEGYGQFGDYWHGIMHRREPDAGNAKYWFRRVGQQRIFPEVAHAAQHILTECSSREAPRWREKVVAGGKWDPFAFIDLCSICESRNDELAMAARHIQFVEMGLLLKETWKSAALKPAL